MEHPTSGIWTAFPNGTVTDGKAGTATLQLSSSALPVRHLRIWMTESSNTADTGAQAKHDPKDPRSAAGYAIREIYIGSVTPAGELVDLIQHRPDQNQTVTLCSSIDPWHSETDINTAGDQTGLDLFFTSGITNNLPAMIPVSMLYSTPDDAAAQMAYLKKRAYPISYVEMGEEPDGQEHAPRGLRRTLPAVRDRDPQGRSKPRNSAVQVFEGVNEDIKAVARCAGPDIMASGFLDYLKVREPTL